MRRVTLAVFGLALLVSKAASAEDEDDYVQLGGFFGPRIFSSAGLLGYNYNQPGHPDLVNSIGLGFRIGKPFLRPWFV